MNDTLQNLLDSLNKLSQRNILVPEQSSWKDDLNFTFGAIGVIGTILAVYSIYQSYKSKKLQNFIYKQAQLALEKEDTESKLTETRQELSNIEGKINTLQNQIQKELPIEARKAVLKDRLDESLENLTRYYTDVISTKEKLEKLGITSAISGELLKNIESEIEPRYLLKDKISNNQTTLTVLSAVSGIAFAAIPYPVGNFIGVLLLLLGIPFLIQIVRYTLIKKSKDKQRADLIIKLFLNTFATSLLLISCLFFILVYATTNNSEEQNTFLLMILLLTVGTLISFRLNLRLYKKYKNK